MSVFTDPEFARLRRDIRRAAVRSQIAREQTRDRQRRGTAAGVRAAGLRGEIAAQRAEALGTRGAERFALAQRESR